MLFGPEDPHSSDGETASPWCPLPTMEVEYAGKIHGAKIQIHTAQGLVHKGVPVSKGGVLPCGGIHQGTETKRTSRPPGVAARPRGASPTWLGRRGNWWGLVFRNSRGAVARHRNLPRNILREDDYRRSLLRSSRT